MAVGTRMSKKEEPKKRKKSTKDPEQEVPLVPCTEVLTPVQTEEQRTIALLKHDVDKLRETLNFTREQLFAERKENNELREKLKHS